MTGAALAEVMARRGHEVRTIQVTEDSAVAHGGTRCLIVSAKMNDIDPQAC